MHLQLYQDEYQPRVGLLGKIYLTYQFRSDDNLLLDGMHRLLTESI